MLWTVPAMMLLASPTPPPLDLHRAMDDPAWLGSPPERLRWTADGRLIFDRRIGRTDERRTTEIDLASGSERPLDLAQREALVPSGDWNPARTAMISVRNGDLVLVDANGGSTQLTRTTARENAPRFLRDGRIAYRRDGTWMLLDPTDASHVESADVRFATPPAPPEASEGLEADQHRLFGAIRDRTERREAARVRMETAQEARGFDVVGPIHLSPDERETGRHLASSGRWILLEVAPSTVSSPTRDAMPIFVTEAGYVESRAIRPKVGTVDRTPERLVLIDRDTGSPYPVDLDDLPGRHVDRLADVRAENAAWLAQDDESDRDQSLVDRIQTLATPAGGEMLDAPREVSVVGVRWNPNEDLAAVMLRSHDNKDRWIVVLDPATLVRETSIPPANVPADDPPLAPTGADATTAIRPPADSKTDPDPNCDVEPCWTLVEHLYDPAWIGWRFNEFDWTSDGDRLWFLSEASGWSDLMTAPSDAPADATPLVAGAFEVSRVSEHPIDGTLWYLTNRSNPSIWNLERVDPGSGRTTTVDLPDGRVESFAIAPDGAYVAVSHSTIDAPREAWLASIAPSGEIAPAARLTESRSDDLRDCGWRPPVLVDVPSRAGRSIRGRLHLPPPQTPDEDEGLRPAILFVHGAGYLQNAHAGWSRYFREGFFHDLLARDGFVVLDLDYRGSAGHGRDWRTAIARDMGRCELDDYEDGIAWLARNHDVDPERIGIYGGSYGGFTTLMGLFTRPGTFKAGAALRPVTDWRFYNDGYTANILNTPQDDPMSYRRSSPIDHAEGLEDALLICHGMVDDNVPFSDSVRLAQRLIELDKEDWELASYPVEPHGFRRPSSWRDEYRRIRALFHRTLKPGANTDDAP